MLGLFQSLQFFKTLGKNLINKIDKKLLELTDWTHIDVLMKKSSLENYFGSVLPSG